MEKRLVKSNCNKQLMNCNDKLLLFFDKEQQYSIISSNSNIISTGSVIKPGSTIQVKYSNQFYDSLIVAIGDENFVNSKKERLEEKLQEMSVHALSFLNEEESLQLPNKQIYTHVATPTHSSAEGVYDGMLQRRRTDLHIEEIPDDLMGCDENVGPELKLVNVLENLNETILKMTKSVDNLAAEQAKTRSLLKSLFKEKNTVHTATTCGSIEPVGSIEPIMHEGVNLCSIVGNEPSKYGINLALKLISSENLKLYIMDPKRNFTGENARKCYPEPFGLLIAKIKEAIARRFGEQTVDTAIKAINQMGLDRKRKHHLPYPETLGEVIQEGVDASLLDNN